MADRSEAPPTLPEPDEAAASGVVLACERAWRAIQRQHPELPDVVVVLGTGVERGRLVKLGHWWGGRWIADGQVRGEVLLAGEALHLQQSQVFEVLLHEAAHGLNAARGVKDSSRGGRYHNAQFKATAEEVGLVVEPAPPYGWANTSLGPVAAERYDSEIAQLGDAMRIARRLERQVRVGEREIGTDSEGSGSDGQPERDRTNPAPATCRCGRRMRMAPSVLAQGPVLCGLCGNEFAVERRAARDSPTAPEPVTPADSRFLKRRTASLTAERASSSHLYELDEELTTTQRDGAVALAKLMRVPGGIAAIVEAGAWYEARRRGEMHALVGRDDAEVATANDVARALLKIDGSLGATAARVDERELVVGELIVVAGNNTSLFDAVGRELPPAGVLGTITAIDTTEGAIEVDFPIAGRHRIAVDSPAARALAYGYAEHRRETGAPLLDLRTLPMAPSPSAEPLAPVVELGW